MYRQFRNGYTICTDSLEMDTPYEQTVQKWIHYMNRQFRNGYTI